MNLTKLPTSDAYQTLKAALLSGRYQAGEKLVTQQLADQLGLSRTPVREALARMEAQGLVTRISNQGYSLRNFSLRDVRDLFEARRVIEVSSAELATHRATEDSLNQMKASLERCAFLLESGELIGFQKAARNFHRIIGASTGNVLLLGMFDQISDLVLLFGLTLLRSSPTRAREILEENQAILACIASGNAEAAGNAMRQHLSQGHRHFMHSLSEFEVDLNLNSKSSS